MHPYWLILLAIGQLLSPPVAMALSGREIGGGDGEVPLLNPAGYAFFIWTPIVLGSLAFSIYQALPAQRDRGVYPALRRPVALLFTLFTLWILAALAEWLWTTVGIFVAMLVCLWRILPLVLSQRPQWTRAETYLVALPFSLYAGWTTIAIFANLAAALVYYRLAPARAEGLAWQAGVLLAAVGAALYGVRRTHGEPFYVATLLWALVAIVVNNLTPPGQLLAALAALAVVGILATALRQHHASHT